MSAFLIRPAPYPAPRCSETPHAGASNVNGQDCEYRVDGLILDHFRILQMRRRTAHGGGFRGDLDAGLIELQKIRHRRASVLAEQNAPPAVLIAIATRS